MPENKIISKFQKNALEEVRISLDKFRGMELINIRVWIKNKSEEFVPTKKGIALPIHLFGELMAGLKKVEGAKE